MATYKVVDADQLNADMSSVADSIRTKGGTTDALAWPDGYKTAIEAIQTGGGGGPYTDVTLITTIEASEDVSAIQIDWQETWNDYDYIFFRPNEITLSVSEWLYVSINSTSKYKYFKKSAIVSDSSSFAIKCDTSIPVNNRFTNLLLIWVGDSNPGDAGVATTYIYLQPYMSTTLIKSGSKIDVLGVKFT